MHHQSPVALASEPAVFGSSGSALSLQISLTPISNIANSIRSDRPAAKVPSCLASKSPIAEAPLVSRTLDNNEVDHRRVRGCATGRVERDVETASCNCRDDEIIEVGTGLLIEDNHIRRRNR